MTQDGHCYDKDDEQATHPLEVHLTNFMGFFFSSENRMEEVVCFWMQIPIVNWNLEVDEKAFQVFMYLYCGRSDVQQFFVDQLWPVGVLCVLVGSNYVLTKEFCNK
jgi:hypothetical protein